MTDVYAPKFEVFESAIAVPSRTMAWYAIVKSSNHHFQKINTVPWPFLIAVGHCFRYNPPPNPPPHLTLRADSAVNVHPGAVVCIIVPGSVPLFIGNCQSSRLPGVWRVLLLLLPGLRPCSYLGPERRAWRQILRQKLNCCAIGHPDFVL